MGYEHLNTIPATESDEFIKSCVENLVPNPSESKGENGSDVPAGFTTFSNVLFDDDYDSDSKLLDNYSLSLPTNESYHFDIPPFSRPLAKPPDGDTGILNIKIMGDISDQKAFMHKLMITLASHQEKSPDLLSHRCGTVKTFNTHRSIDGVTTSLQRSRNSRLPMLDHQDKYMMKAQHILRGRLLASFQDREHEGGDIRLQGGIKDNDLKIKIQDHSMLMEMIRLSDPAEMVPEIAPMTMGEVSTRVTELTELHKHETQDLYALLEDAQDNRTRISQRVTQHQLHETRFQMHQTEISELRETDRRRQEQMVETLRVMGDIRREMGDMQAERIMAPVTRQGPNVPPNNANPNNMNPEFVQAMIDQALLRNSTNRDGSHSSHEDSRRNMQTARPCFYSDFMKCQPLNFKGTEDVVSLTRWIEKMESVFQISGCVIENQVKFATCTLLDASLTLWNIQIRSLGPDAYSMTWEVLKKKITNKYCPQGEIKKLEIKLWNLKVKGNDVAAYIECFQKLTLICTKFVANETEKIDKYVNGLLDNIYGSVKASKPKTLDETIELANDLKDQKLRTYAKRKTNNKRKADKSFRNNHGHQHQPLKKQNVAKVYNMGTSEKSHTVEICPSAPSAIFITMARVPRSATSAT
nr:hypothetical protein [Tanacetum cinerariifolium]